MGGKNAEKNVGFPGCREEKCEKKVNEPNWRKSALKQLFQHLVRSRKTGGNDEKKRSTHMEYDFWRKKPVGAESRGGEFKQTTRQKLLGHETRNDETRFWPLLTDRRCGVPKRGIKFTSFSVNKKRREKAKKQKSARQEAKRN